MKPPSVPLRKNQLFSGKHTDSRIGCTARMERALRAINQEFTSNVESLLRYGTPRRTKDRTISSLASLASANLSSL